MVGGGHVGTSRAHETMDTNPDAPHDALTETRIAHVMSLMERLQFKRGTTVETLAAEWGLSETSVRHITTIASRRVRARLEDPDVVHASIAAKMCAIIETGEDRDAIAAAKAWSEISGTAAPKKLEHSGKIDGIRIFLPPEDVASAEPEPGSES